MMFPSVDFFLSVYSVCDLSVSLNQYICIFQNFRRVLNYYLAIYFNIYCLICLCIYHFELNIVLYYLWK